MLLRARWLLLGLAAVVLVVHSLAYDFVTDDAYISFVYSRNFAEHGQLVFNLGDPVEGYTNFSWTLLIGLLMLVGIPPELSSRLLGTICALGTLWLVFRIVERALERPSPWAGVAPLLLACSSGFACWTSGGLETQLFTLLVVAALDAVVAAVREPRAIRRAGWLLALAAMTRPEGPLIAAVLGGAWVVHRVVVAGVGDLIDACVRGLRLFFTWRFREFGAALVARLRGLREELLAIAWFLGLWAPWFAWRWWYYGYPFPNTYYVKASGPWADPKFASQMVDNGAYYIWVWLRQTGLYRLAPLALVGLVAVKPKTPRFVLGLACGLLLAVYIPYAIAVGGDFMGLHRFIMPLFPVAAIALVLGIEFLARLLASRGTLAVAGIALAGILAYARFEVQAEHDYTWAQLALAVPIAIAFAGRFLPEKLRWIAAAGAIAVVAGAFAWTQLELTRTSLRPTNLIADRGVIDTPAFLIVYTEDRAKIGRAMETCFRDDDFSIVGGAGAQPYYARMRGIDVFGLVSDRIAHEEPRIRARAGHTKWGNDRLLADYDPTFVFSCYDIHRSAAQPQLPCAGFWRARGFEEVTMFIPGLRERGEYYTFLAKKSRAFECTPPCDEWRIRYGDGPPKLEKACPARVH